MKLTWQDVNNYVSRVANIVKDRQLSGVYGIPRGGLVLAVMLSHKLNIPLLSAPADKCLVVDDICDSGETLLHICKNTSGKKQDIFITTMAFKRNDFHIVPHFWYVEKCDEWVVFPWEE